MGNVDGIEVTGWAELTWQCLDELVVVICSERAAQREDQELLQHQHSDSFK